MDKKKKQSTVMTVTPFLAKCWLEKNFDGNRKVNKDIVSFYADQMRRGMWQLNGDSIRFDTSGNLLDGQHRLLACVMANVPFDTFVTYGIDMGAYITQNGGYKAKTADHLRFNNIKSSTVVAAIVSAYLKLQKGIFSKRNNKNSKISDIDVLDFYNNNSDIIDKLAGKYSSWGSKTKIMAPMAACSFIAYSVIDRGYDLDFMIDFIEKIVDFKYFGNDTILNTRDFLRRIYESKNTTTKWLYEQRNIRLLLVYSFKKWLKASNVKSFSTFVNAIRNGEAGDVDSIPYCEKTLI